MTDKVLLFSYFKGHGDGLHLAISTDGYHWQALQQDAVILTPQTGIEKIMRDPCLFFGEDKMFHLVWTSGWNERGIGYTQSKDLIHWKPQQYLPVMEHDLKVRNCWAPEIFYDRSREVYFIYWSSTVDDAFAVTQPFGDDGYNHRLYYVTTKDFVVFTKAALLYDSGFNVIDGNIVQDGDRYLLFIKNETLTPPQKNIRFTMANDILQFGNPSEPLTPSHYWAEGPTAIKHNGEWIVYFDKYKINEIGAIRSADLLQWEDISHLVHFPQGAQHGYVTSVERKYIQYLL